MDFQKRAKSSEAKANLGALYTAEKAYFYEASLYSNDLDIIGFSAPDGKREYAVGFTGTNGQHYFGTETGDPGTATASSGASATEGKDLAATCTFTAGTSFKACASGTTSTKEDFNINENKIIASCGATRSC